MKNKEKYVNTLQFRELGIKSVRACIGRLRHKGIKIITDLSDVIDSAGITRKGIAHYSLKGVQ